MAALPIAARDAFLSDLSLAQAAARAAKVPSRVLAEDNTWIVWRDFCLELSVDPLLENVTDPIPYFQVFGQRYRDGRLAKDGKPVHARTVEDAMRQIGQTMASLGAKDHRLIGPKQIDFRLSRQIAGYKTTDPPPNRVKPVPMGLIHDVHTAARISSDTFALAVADMAVIATYYLCRLGKYAATTQSSSRHAPFRLEDVECAIQNGIFRASTVDLTRLPLAQFTSLIFTTQKNGVTGEKVGHGRSLEPFACPVLAITRRVQHLRGHHAAPDTPLYMTLYNNAWKPVKSADITAALRTMAAQQFHVYGLSPAEISARSLRAGGAMALLCAKVDTDIIKLVGRWRSDEMLRYLHLQAYPLMRNLAPAMASHGSFTLLPMGLPAAALPILQAAQATE